MFKALARLASGKKTKAASPAEPSAAKNLPIIVPQSAVDALPDDPKPIVGAVIDYVNTLINDGHFSRDQMPPLALQAYHTDYYLAQVDNGGHVQFTHNCGANLPLILEDVSDALTSMGASPYLDIFTPYNAWLRKHPKGSRGRDSAQQDPNETLDSLDIDFYNLEQVDGLRLRLAGWIAAAPNLSVVPDGDLADARAAVCALNPQYADRQRTKAILNLHHQLTDPVLAAVAFACGQTRPLAPMVAMGNGSYRDVSGRKLMCLFITTTLGPRWAVIDGTSVAIHEGDDLDGTAREARPLEAPMEQNTGWTSPQVGPQLAAVTAQQVSPVIALAREFAAAATIDRLLMELDETPRIDRVTIRSAGPGPDGHPGMTLLLLLDHGTRAMTVVVTQEGAILLSEPDHTRLAGISRAQIEAHAAEFADGL